MEIAVIGSGISGLGCAWRLCQADDAHRPEVTVYEAEPFRDGVGDAGPEPDDDDDL